MSFSPLAIPVTMAVGPALSGVQQGMSHARDFFELFTGGGELEVHAEGAVDVSAESATAGSGQGELAQLQAEAEAALQEFAATLRDRLAQVGIDGSLPFELVQDERDGLQVSGSHPQAEGIAALLTRDDDLADQFELLAATFSSIDQLQEIDQLHERFGLGSVVAADHYARVHGTAAGTQFGISLRGDEAEASLR